MSKDYYPRHFNAPEYDPTRDTKFIVEFTCEEEWRGTMDNDSFSDYIDSLMMEDKERRCSFKIVGNK